MHRSFPRLGALALLATIGFTTAMETFPAEAQTTGMTRRQDRRDTRQTSRDVKHECNANTQGSRADCRHAKQSTKQAGRENGPQPDVANPPH